MSPIITLTTDFGSRDGYVGAMKGKILSICPSANIVDISHSISPQSIIGAAFCLSRAAPLFPTGSIHMAVVDPTVGSQRKALLIKTEKFYLLGPDNGIFSLILEIYPPEVILEIFIETESWRSHSSFDGLELFAPVAAYLAKGGDLKNFGKVIENCQKVTIPKSFISDDQIMGEVILFDRFGNAITNIEGAKIHKMEKICISLPLENQKIIIPLRDYYSQNSDLKNSEVAIINSDGLLELSVFQGSIRQKHNLKKGQPVKAIRNP